MAGIASALTAGAAVIGAGTSVYGALKKGQGVAANNAAMGQIYAEELARQRDYYDQANQIAKWYNDQSQGNFDDTFTKSSPEAQAALRTKAEVDRTATGINAISANPTGAMYTDQSGSDASKKESARQLSIAFDRARSHAVNGAKVNAYGDAVVGTGFELGRGQQNQQGINMTGAMRGRLNQMTHSPVLSTGAKMALAGGAGAGDINTGDMLMAGGNLLSAAGAYGLPQKAYNGFSGLFAGPVPTDGSMGPVQPGALYGWFS